MVRDLTSNESRASGFIGRQTELATLAAALDHALAGRGQMVMLAGEPGIGKTRLGRELAVLRNSVRPVSSGDGAMSAAELLPIGPGCSPSAPT